jgi:hypothetical protein
VAERPDEQLAPKMPIFSALALCMAMRSRIDAVRANTDLLHRVSKLELEQSHRVIVTVTTGRE